MSLIALLSSVESSKDGVGLSYLDSPGLALAAALFGLGMRPSATSCRHHQNMSVGM